MSIALTDKHVEIYKAIKSYYKTQGYSPTIREIQKMCGYGSTSTVYKHLKTLEKAGYIKMGTHRSRTIKIL